MSTQSLWGQHKILFGLPECYDAGAGVTYTVYRYTDGTLAAVNNANASDIQGAINVAWTQISCGSVNHTISETEPAGSSVGDEWYVSSTGVLYKRTNDTVSDIWIDISTVVAAGSVNTAGAAFPATPKVGDTHYLTPAGVLYKRINDTASDVWIQIS